MQLKMRGPQSSAELGEIAGTTGEAARQQLLRLQEDGLVEAVADERERKSAGRPKQIWQLSNKGQSRFPDTHAAMTVDLLRIVRNRLGAEALDEIILAREEQTRIAYAATLASRQDLRERVIALAGMRSQEGYMAEWSERENGTLVLVENHCPICAAATECQGFCRAELAVFRAVLGPDVTVQREEHLLSGGRRCAYTIKGKDSA